MNPPKIIVLLLVSFSIGIYALDIPIGSLTAIDNNSVLELHCLKAWDGTKQLADSIGCECTQLSISFPETSMINNSYRQLDSTFKSKPSDAKKQIDTLCAICQLNSTTKYPHKWQSEMTDSLKKYCLDKQLRSRPIDFLRRLDTDKSTLQIQANHFNLSLKKRGPSKWVSFQTDQGFCGRDMVITIEKINSFQWKYTQITTGISDTSSLCTSLSQSINKPIIFTQEKEPIFRIRGYEYLKF